METLNELAVNNEEKRRAKMLLKSFNRIISLDGGLSGQQSINVAREFMNQLGAYTPFEWKPQSTETNRNDLVTVPRNQLADYCP